MFDIIVVHYGDRKVTERAITSISRNSIGDYRLTVYDNDCNNRGWVRTVNLGLSISTSPFIVICNNDIEVLSPDWLAMMAIPFRESHIAAVGPLCPNPRQGHQNIRRGQGFIEGTPYFYCIMLSREAFLDVGLLDTHFAPHGIGDDDDWLMRAKAKGWKVGIQTDVEVDHFRSGEWYKDGSRDRIAVANQKKLREKYAL